MLRKYGTATHIYIPIVKASSANFAVGADWTPAAGDVKISKDGGAAANVTNLPSAIAMGNGAMWDFSLTATEMQAASVVVIVADSATKAVEDQAIVIETYGNASGEHAFDLDTATQAVTVASGGITAASIATDAIDADALADGAITAATFAAGAIDATAIAADAIGSSELAASAVTEMQAGLASQASVDTLAGYVDTEVAAIKAKTDNLPASPAATGDIPTAATVADAVWDEARSGHVAAGSFGEGVASVQGNVTGSVASVSGAVGSVTGNVGGNVTGSVGSVAAGGITASSIAADAIGASELAADAVTEIANAVTIPSAASIADAVWDEATTGHTTSGTFGEQLKTDVDAILVDTAEIGAAGAGLTALASQASVNTIDDLLDTEVAAIKSDTAAILADTGTDGVVVASINANAVTASALAADAVTEIQAGLATAAAVAAIAGYVDTEVAAILAAVDTEVAAIKAKTDLLPAAPAATGDIPTAAQVRDAILAGTVDELAAVPAASPTVEQALAFLFMALRNKVTTSTTQTKIHNDAGTVVGTASVSDSGSVFERGEYA